MKNFTFKKRFQQGGTSSSSAMLLLDHKGKPQMKLYGSELIFSAKSSSKFIKKAKELDGSDEDFYELGEMVWKERMAQRKRDGY